MVKESSKFLFGALVLLVLMPSVCLAAGEPQPLWIYESTDAGVALYHQQDAAEGLLPFKAVAELDSASEQIVLALLEAEQKPLWAPKLKGTTVHATVAPNRFQYSEYYTTPWPFKDREFLLLGTITRQGETIVFSAVDAPDRHYRDDRHVQANIHELTFAVIPLATNRTRVEFTFSGDLGGWIPDFVQEIIQKRWPVRFIQALQGYLRNNTLDESERYRLLEKVLAYDQRESVALVD
ncbi:START domain-containing protein [Desulfuromonas acetoxidans]|uniref:START domain-containing protein n=1 Tax=Desulfuromonas acetoxidans TaxID=891 RepID=UPI00292D0FC9|nr:START domain-containing protein [Desulfuromonas acetoxidans]